MKIAIIGMGVMGRNHYRVLKSTPGVEVAALCDTALAGSYPERISSDVGALLSAEKLDAAVIAVPTPFHTDVALRCVERGIHVLIEKPVASKLADAQRVLNAVKASGVRAAIGHTERFNPVVRALKQQLQGKSIYSISFTRIGPIPPRISDVGILSDLAVHDIDLLRFLTGRDIARQSIYTSRKIHNHFEDNAILSFQLEGDIVANITTDWLTPFKKRTIHVATQEAYYEADLIAQELTEFSSYADVKDDNTFVTRVCFVQKGEPLRNEHAAFADLVATGRPGDLASIEDSIRTLQVIEGRGGRL